MKKTLKKLAIIISTLMLILLIQAILGVKGVMATIPNKDGTFIEKAVNIEETFVFEREQYKFDD